MNENIIAKGKRIINVKIKGLENLCDSLGDNFANACNLILNCKGRIVVSGMGKSGHIGNKIASTFASTGTPAIFVHPAEALHGDLGMVTQNDVALMLSNSGNTTELYGMINYCNRFSIPIIAITRDLNSELGKAATITLQIPNAEEACSLGLAPTTSTTNTLALGDAIAITLLELKGFSSEDFKVFHPGGSLGNKLIKVKDIMHKSTEMPLIQEGKTMAEAIIVITSYRFGCAGVVSQAGKLIGVITDGDIRRHMNDGLLKASVNEIMTTSFVTIKKQENSSHVLLLMNNKKITSVFVIDDDTKPIGIIHIHDLIKLGVI